MTHLQRSRLKCAAAFPSKVMDALTAAALGYIVGIGGHSC